MQTIRVNAQEAGLRLDRFLCKYFPLAPKSFIYKMLRKKNIKLNGKRSDGAERLCAGDEITLYLADQTIHSFRTAKGEYSNNVKQGRSCADTVHQQGSSRASSPKKPGLSIVFEDEDILVVNKPTGMLSQKADRNDISLVEYLTEYLEDELCLGDTVFRPGICNRLDRNTSGLVVAGKSVQGLQWMNRLFRERDLRKYYLCVVCGEITRGSRIDGWLRKDEKRNKVTVQMEASDGASRIETEYEPLGTFSFHSGKYTVLKVHLITGRSHQIRAHLQSIGHPVIGDTKYGSKEVNQLFRQAYGLRCQALHAWRLELGSPEYLPDKYRGQIWEASCPAVLQEISSCLCL